MGLAKVEYPRVILNRPQYFLLWGGLAGLFFAMAFTLKNYVFLAPGIVFLVILIGYMVRLKGLFYDCDVNIGKVLNADENLYAVGLNLNGQGMAEKLCVVITKGRVPKVSGFVAAEKGYFPAISYPNYNKKPGEADKVMTMPYAVGVSKSQSLKFQYDHLESNIEDFEKTLEQLSKPYTPGLYYIDSEKL